jgi:hypothetical protein
MNLPSLSLHHRLALVGATATSAIALTDALTHGLTGSYSAFADDSGAEGLILVGDLVHGLTYAAFCFVLVREAERIDAAGRVAGVLRRVLLVSLAFLAVGFLVGAPLRGSIEGSAFEDVWGLVATAAFIGMILSALALGPALLRRTDLRVGALVLTALLPVVGLTALLAVLAPAFAHPAYLETTLHFGIALLGVGAVSTQGRAPRRVEQVA